MAQFSDSYTGGTKSRRNSVDCVHRHSILVTEAQQGHYSEDVELKLKVMRGEGVAAASAVTTTRERISTLTAHPTTTCTLLLTQIPEQQMKDDKRRRTAGSGIEHEDACISTHMAMCTATDTHTHLLPPQVMVTAPRVYLRWVSIEHSAL